MNENDAALYWSEAQPSLKAAFSSVVYDTLIKPLLPIKIEDNLFLLQSDENFFRDIIEQRYQKRLTDIIKAISEKNYEVKIVLQEELLEVHSAKPKSKQAPERQYITNLKPKYIFESFVRGKSNSLAFAASVAVAEAPGKTKYNPLFIYGGVGLGKTHLMQSIGNYIIEQEPSTKVLYTSSENFTNELIASIRSNKNQEFRAKYRDIDVLLIDDIQFISEKEGTQEEFFHTFNTLYDANKQIVISSDQPPIELKTLEERLRSRFGSGLIVDITLPDFETRTAILEKKAELDNLDVPKDVMYFIAKNIISNIRELEGALNKVAAYARLSNNELTMNIVEDALKDMINDNVKRDVTVEYIQELVAEHYGISQEELKSKKRTQKITYARHVAMYLCRKLLSDSLTAIGAKFGGRDHTTIIHGCNKITEEIETDSALKDLLLSLEKKIKNE